MSLKNRLDQLPLHEIRDFMIDLARKAGGMIRNADPSVGGSDEKNNSADRVTATDKAVEDMVHYTNYRLLVERKSQGKGTVGIAMNEV